MGQRTLLYHIVEQHYPAFVTHMAQQERPLPEYVQQEFEDYLRCGRLGVRGKKGSGVNGADISAEVL